MAGPAAAESGPTARPARLRHRNHLIAAMLAWAGVAAFVAGCSKSGPTKDPPPRQEVATAAIPSLESLLKEAETLYGQGRLEERRRKVDEAHGLYPADTYWTSIFQLPPYLRHTRVEVYIWWNRAFQNPKEHAHAIGEARRLAVAMGSEELVAKTDYRIALHLLGENRPLDSGLVLQTVVDRARALGEANLLALSLINLSVTRMRFDRYDEVIPLCNEAARLLNTKPLTSNTAILENNLGWSYLQLGKGEEALRHLQRSLDIYGQVKSKSGEQQTWQNLAAYYLRQGDLGQAEESLRRAVEASVHLTDEERAAVFVDLAEVTVLKHDLDGAADAITKARTAAHFAERITSHNDAHIRLVEAMIQDERNDVKAESGYAQVASSKVARTFLRVEAAVRRARWLVAHKRLDDAEAQFNGAVQLLDGMRNRLDRDESKLSFFEDISIYPEYVDLLINRGKMREALVVADRSRARLLSDYQSRLRPLNIESIQAKLGPVKGLALFYWIGGQRPYLWMIGPKTFKAVPLKAKASEMRTLAQQYYEAVSTPSLTAGQLEGGRRLRKILLDPAVEELTPDRRVFLVLDDQLGLLNPESLPLEKSGWWIDEAIVSIVPSLALLDLPRKAVRPGKALLAIGNATKAGEYDRLANAAGELAVISELFPRDQLRVIEDAGATPPAYGKANPQDYEMIHFTAHGKAESGNPLDSAVILSEDPSTKAFKLYAREIVTLPIAARLVTISACKSAAGRNYRGEGPVGLAWAFLSAGAEQVVAGLWNVDDAASKDLMERFYAGMRKQHKSAAVALRDAKRQIMTGYNKPYYWAPFELFAGYIEP